MDFLAENVRIHDEVAARYDELHSEIFNPTEQRRLKSALERAWGRTPGIDRFWVHTCTNDHPDALAFYVRSGFVPYARGIECYRDPRLEGLLPKHAAAHIPII